MTALGCSDPVDKLVWSIKHPRERGPDGLSFAVDTVRQGNHDRRAAQALVPLLHDQDVQVRSTATGVLGVLKSAGQEPITTALVKMTKDPEKAVKVAALQTLGNVRPSNAAIVDALKAGAKAGDAEIRTAAIEGISALGQGCPPEVVPTLIEALNDAATCGPAARALGQIGQHAREAKHPLFILASSSDAHSYARLGAAKAIWAIDADSELVVPLLVDLLQSDYYVVRRDAAEALGVIGPPAHDALPALQQAADSRPTGKSTSGASASPSEGRSTRAMTDEEMFPQVRAAALAAIQEIQRLSQSRPR
jgi:HEAT repeat protein